MPLQFDAHAALERLHVGFQRYLLEELRLGSPGLQEALARAWAATPTPGGWHDALLAEPLYEAAFGFQTASDLRTLVREGVLRPETAAAFKPTFGVRPLFRHQECALRNARAGNTVAVSAGTGSGKTEAFFLPILDQLYRDHAEGRDDLTQPGVRVLIVYPLNALVNNQVDRIRDIVAAAPDAPPLRFASYTGRLPETRCQGERAFEEAFGRAPPPQQLVSRQEVRDLPPHILVTNFSMLEYMIIRQVDAGIFSESNLWFRARTGSLPRLRAIVLDEAHVYAGAQAAEIHMLLRRACQRFGTRLEDVQGYATSATLQSAGGSEALVEYAAQMFAKPRARVRAIEGCRAAPPLPANSAEISALVPVTDAAARGATLDNLSTLTYDGAGRPTALRLDPEATLKVLGHAEALGLVSAPRAADLHRTTEEPARALWEALGASTVVRDLVTHLSTSARRLWTVPELATVAFRLEEGAQSPDHLETVRLLLRLGSLARRDAVSHPLLPVRVHAFLRAPAGIWADLRSADASASPWPWKGVTMRPPRQGDADQDDRYAEVWTCGLCGAPFVGPLNRQSLRPDPRGDNLFFALSAERASSWQGTISTLPDGPRGVVLPMERGRDGDRLHGTCPACLAAEPPVYPARMSAENAVGVLVDLLYPSLPAMPDDEGRPSAHLPGEGRRLLLMSDSRQGAAGLASQVESGHDRVLGRQLLLRVLRDEAPEGGEVQLDRLAQALAESSALRRSAEARALWGAGLDGARELDLLENVAEAVVWRELAVPPPRGRSLETLGLVEVCYPGLERLPLPVGVGDLSLAEWRDFARTVLDDARSRGVGTLPTLQACDVAGGPVQADLPRWATKALVLEGGDGQPDTEEPDARGTTVALVAHPDHRGRSRVFRYAQAVARAAGVPAEDGALLLRKLWEQLTSSELNLHFRRWLRYDALAQCLRIGHRGLHARAPDRPAFLDRDDGRAWPRSVRKLVLGVEQRAALRSLEEDRELFARHAERHAVRRARALEDLDPALYAEEHTAQMEADGNGEKERMFRRGLRNLLSTSTTMEMGVDLGGLTGVVCTNVPPAASNYWQRAGRAGRRAEGSSLALTLCRNRLHDQRVFEDPRRFLESPIVAPRVVLDAEALLLRHVHAALLSLFFSQRPVVGAGGGNQTFGSVGTFFLGDAPAEPDFRAWLSALGATSGCTPDAAHIRAIVEGTGLTAWSLQELCDDAERTIAHAASEVSREANLLRDQLEAAGMDAEVRAAIKRDQTDLQEEKLIPWLVRAGFLPRFGFPIDLVRLNVRLPNDIDDVPDFERDITVALAEYAPGARVVAGKRVYESAGVVKNWLDAELNALRRTCYVACTCGHVQVGIAAPRTCEVCGAPFGAIGNVDVANAGGSEADAVDGAFAAQGARGAPAGELRPQPRSFFRPAGFSTRRERPRLLRYAGTRTRLLPGRATVQLLGAASSRYDTHLDGALHVAFTADSRLLVRSEGRSDDPEQPGGFGFAICKACGRAAPESRWSNNVGTPPPGGMVRHVPLRRSAGGECNGPFWRNAVLGSIRRVDALRVRLDGPLLPPTAVSARRQAKALAFTLAALLVPAVSDHLQVDPRGLTPTVCAWQRSDGTVAFEAVVYEDAASGQLARLAPLAPELLRRAVELANAGSWIELVRFDNQFGMADAELDLAGFRAHFANMPVPGPPALNGSEVVPGRNVQERLANLLAEAGSTPPLVVARGIAPDAEADRNDPLRAMRVAALRGARVRLLLARPAATPDRLADARIVRLLEDGIEVREGDPDLLVRCPWRLAGTWLGEPAVFGALGPDGVERTPNEERELLGSGWLAGYRLLRPMGEDRQRERATQEALAEVEEAWDTARPLSAEDLRVRLGAGFARIAPGTVLPAGALLAPYLCPILAVASLEALGPVTELTYEDVYVGRRSRTLAALDRLLGELRFAPDAQVSVRHGVVAEVPVAAGELPRDDVRREEFALVRKWREQIDLSFAHVRHDGRVDLVVPEDAEAPPGRVEHFRRLRLRTSSGRAIEMFLDKGLDWARPSPDGEWRTTAETFVLVVG